MIALDTNLLIRLLTRDDEAQACAVEWLLGEKSSISDPAFVGRIVLVETIWVLQRHYRYSRPAIAAAIDLLLQIPSLRVQNEAATLDALDLYTQSQADFADITIMLDALSHGASPLYTLDKRAARLPNCELLGIKRE